MTESVRKNLEFLKSKKYREQRISKIPGIEELNAIKAQKNKQKIEGDIFTFAAGLEQPVFYGDDIFGFNRMYVNPTDTHGRYGNAVPDYARVLGDGLDSIYSQVKQNYDNTDSEGRDFYDAVLVIYDAFFDLIERYRKAASKQGQTRLATALERVPRRGARDYYEALVSLKATIFALRLVNTVHLPLGRFDMYMKPYFDKSLENGASLDELFELTELFFININYDSDIYVGVQQGDNGQSMVLGGCDKFGEPCFNDLSEMCLMASEELNLIDPKINLRVNSKTPLSLYERGTRLTKRGLGFPQYCNDDIAIPYLTSLGYELADARDYAVAACWEFIVPAFGADIPNMRTVNLPKAIEKATARGLAVSETFDEFMGFVREELIAECEEKKADCYGAIEKYYVPLFSSLINPCIERARDLARGGAKYHNYGFHGAGISTAADAVCAI